jgi:hypothetical protein
MKKILTLTVAIFLVSMTSFAQKADLEKPIAWQGTSVKVALKKINATESQTIEFVDLFSRYVGTIGPEGNKITLMDMGSICMSVFAIGNNGDKTGDATEADYKKCTDFMIALADEQNRLANVSEEQYQNAVRNPAGKQISTNEAEKLFEKALSTKCNPKIMSRFRHHQENGYSVPDITNTVTTCKPVSPYKENVFDCIMERFLSDKTKCVVECSAAKIIKTGNSTSIEGNCGFEQLYKQ